MNHTHLRPGQHAVPALATLCLMTAAGIAPAQAGFEFGDAEDGLQVTLDPLIQGRYSYERDPDGSSSEFDFRLPGWTPRAPCSTPI